MEHLIHLGGRLLGKKSTAIILGLLGLLGPLSLSAEKLDTTFVLDMVIDTTPCYYTRYNSAGQITDHGIYRTPKVIEYEDYYEDYFRINTGYVTNEKGDTVGIVYYTCDNVTKQWIPNNIKGIGVEYHDNGMLGETKYTDYTIAEAHHLWDEETNEKTDVYRSVPDHILEYKFRPDGYRLSWDYVDMIYGTDCGYPWEDVFDEDHYKYDSLGNAYYNSYAYVYCNYTNTYDDRKNLISSLHRGNHQNMLEEHSYDSLDRRIKTIRYDSTEAGFVIRDSIIYTYGNSLKEGEPYILSVFRIDQPIDSFSSDQFNYDFSSIATYKNFRFITPLKTSVEKSIDPETNALSVMVKGANYDEDSTDVNTYTFILKKMESYITSAYLDNEKSGLNKVEFSPEKYSYDTFKEYNFHSFYFGETMELETDGQIYDFDFYVSKDAKAENSYDAQTGVITITVKGGDYEVNPTNVHTYTFATKKIEANISSLQIRGNDFDEFSPDKYDYEMPQNYIWGGKAYPFYLTAKDFVFPGYNDLLHLNKSYSDSTHTLSLSLTIAGDTLSSYRFHFQPCLWNIDLWNDSISLPVQGFAPDKFEYELPSTYKGLSMKYNAEKGTLVRESFDESTNTLTLSVSHAEDSSRITNYTFHFIDECLYYPSLFVTTEGGLPADHMLMDSLKYETTGNYDEFLCQCDVLNGKVLKSEYDDSTSIWTIVVTDVFGINNTEYRIHFRPLPSISALFIDGEPVDSFSPDIHDYWLDREYTPDLVSYNLPEGVVATESFDDSTSVLTISVRFATENTTQPVPATSQNMALPVRHAPNNTSVTVEYRIHFRPTDGVDDFLGDQVSLYVMDKTICVDGAEEPLFVYDLLGSLVGTGRGEEVRIPVPQTGVYVVRAGGKATKVVVR